jgi:hypothetical protein
MRKLFKRRPQREEASSEPRCRTEPVDDKGPVIVSIGRISDLTLGTNRPKTDDPNKWGDKDG